VVDSSVFSLFVNTVYISELGEGDALGLEVFNDNDIWGERDKCWRGILSPLGVG